MGIFIDPTPAKPDRTGMVKPTFETIAKVLAGIGDIAAGKGVSAAGKFAGAASSGIDVIKGFRATKETREQRVWTHWRESLALALPEFFVTASLTRRPDDEELSRLLQEILEDSETLAKAGQAEFMDVHRRTPTDFPLYPPLRDKLPAWARKVAPEHLRDDERLREKLDRSFERGFRRALADRGDHFASILDFFEGEEAETGNRRDAWRRYYEGLSREIEEKPLFNQPEDGSGATLGQIFQPLRCYWRERAKRSRQEEDEAKPNTLHIAWLQSELEGWLERRRSSDALRVVTGGPGSGKSSSALWFARDVAYAGSFNVFVVRLQGLEVDRPIDAVVDEFVEFAGVDHGMLEENPLKWVRDDPKPLLLVFDGLDEVARPDGAGLDVTKTFLRTLHTRLGLANREGKARLMALALGRPQAAEEAALAMGGSLDDQALLHVASLSPMDHDMFVKLGERWAIELDDPDDLAGEDFRATFYERYRPFDAACSGAGTPEALGDGDLVEMTVEPLLLYLLIISGYAGKEWHLAKENRNRIYERIFEGIHERDLKKPVGHPAKMGIEDKKDFLALMECLGLAAWLGGGRSGSDEDFALVRDEVYLPERKGDFCDMPSAKLDNVALQTFTHRDDREKPGYAFIHKSFGEYLTARALVDAGERWCGARAPSRLNLFAEDWLQLTGDARLTTDILRFLIDEARLRSGEPAKARRRITALSTIASHTLAHGFPAHGKLVTDKRHADWRRREIFQRNAEESLYALIHAWAEAGYPFEVKDDGSIERDWDPGSINVAWTTKRAAADMLARLGDQWSDGTVARQLFQCWDLSEANLGRADLSGANLFGANLSGANLFGATLRGANLSEADLSGADLSEANLRGATLRGATLSGADLSGADLSGANLFGANLSGANLSEANLSEADLSGADLSEANLRGATLRGATLSGADLSGADLSGADLFGANLSGANLSEAKCSRFNIDSARLHFAKCSGAIDLSQEQIDKALGNSETELPKGMTHPPHWLEEA